MKKLIIVVIALAIIISSWFMLKKSDKADGFKITGTVTGFADSTKIYLQDASPVVKLYIIDSAQVANGQFTLKGKIAGKTLYVMLTTKNNEDYCFLWIENGEMTFKADKGKF